MEKMEIVFIGGLSNGKVVIDYLLKNKYVNFDLIITYPSNSNKSGSIDLSDYKNHCEYIEDLEANNHIDQIKNIQPDYIFVAGWSGLLSNELISIPKKGTIGFHPSKLPYNRGRSVIAWQIEEGYKETTLTMFYYNDFPDGGDIIAQEPVKIEYNDYISDVLKKFDDATYNLMRAYFPLLRKGEAPRTQQDLNKGNFRRLRTDQDSLIDWDRNSIEIYNKIRAISKPYPGAIGIINGKKYRIWKSEMTSFNFGESSVPCSLVARLFDGSLIIKTRDSFIRILDHELIGD